MSEPSPGPGWWLASDGRWYPPKEAEQPPAPGWWLASDGKWYPPKEAEQPPAPGWWLASDGKWYPPEPSTAAPAVATATPAAGSSKPKPGKVGRSKGKAGRSRGRRRGPSEHRPTAEPTPTTTRSEVSGATRPEPAPTPVGAMATAAPQDRVRPNHNEGLSPLEQIERRNEASRADARVLAAKRAEAAGRALGALQSELSALATAPTRRDVEVPDLFQAPAAPSRPEPPSELSIDPTPPPRPAQPPPTPAPPRPTAAPAGPSTAPAGPSTAPAGPSTAPAGPLLEVKSSPLSTDLEHLGDRLAIFPDRVELRDRLDRLRHTIHRDDIVDVTVTKRLTGAILTVHSAKGIDIVAKGLRADQADEAHALILTKTRPVDGAPATPDVPAVPAATAAAAPAAAPAPVRATSPTPPAPPRPKMDQADLIAKLGDLRRAGVLTEDEYVQKVELVARLARLEELAPSRG